MEQLINLVVRVSRLRLLILPLSVSYPENRGVLQTTLETMTV